MTFFRSRCPLLRVDPIARPSPNHDDRKLPVTMIVLHYTGMPSAEGALDRLCSPEARVSCHYLIDEDGATYSLVDEERRAWSASSAAPGRTVRPCASGAPIPYASQCPA